MAGGSGWGAPAAGGAVRGVVEVCGSKSMTNRGLILAALSREPATIHRALLARDSQLMIAALRCLGVGVVGGDSSLVISPTQLAGPARIDCGLSGNVMRFGPPLAALATGTVSFDGDAGARLRPMAETIDALLQLGVAIDDGGRGALPFTITGTGAVAGGSVTLDASRSSQFVSGLLLAASRFDRGAVITHRGSPLPSQPHIQMTIDMVRAAGGHIEVEKHHDGANADPTETTWDVSPAELNLGTLEIEPDLSNAAAFLAAAMVTNGSVTVPGWPATTTQAGDAIRGIFVAMGGHAMLSRSGLTITGPVEVSGIDIDLADVGELTPTIAAVAAVATSPSRLRGIGHLRGHETDRIAALATEITRLGGSVTESADSLTVSPQPLKPALVRTYHDHRMATFGAILGLVVPGITVENIATTAKTIPDFPAQWHRLVDPDQQ